MKFTQFMKYITIMLLLGIMAGALFANCLADTYVVKSDMFSEYYLLNYLNNYTIRFHFVLRIIMIRVIPFCILFCLRHAKISKVLCFVFLLWTGFSSGLLISVELMNLGTCGILFYLTGAFPQILFYAPAYFICLLEGMKCTNEYSEKMLLICAGCMFVGICLEIYINPVLVKEIIRFIF